jgi:hypothetical protein
MDPFWKGFGKAPTPAASERWVPDGTRVYCVGDLQSRDNRLRQMAERVEADTEPSSFDNAACIFEQTLLRLLDGEAEAF